MVGLGEVMAAVRADCDVVDAAMSTVRTTISHPIPTEQQYASP
jgi:pyruvate/oxaloacetate carboxyltransferase